MREPLGIIDILIARDAAVDGLAQQVRQRKLGVLPVPRVGQVLGDEFAEAQTFVQLAHQNQTTIGGDARSLKIDPEGGVERELKRRVLFLTHWGIVLRIVSVAFKPA